MSKISFCLVVLATISLSLTACDKEKKAQPASSDVKSFDIKGEHLFEPEDLSAVTKVSKYAETDALLKLVEKETNVVVLAQLATLLSKTTSRGPSVRAAFRKMLQSESPDLREQTLYAIQDYAGVNFMMDDMIPLLTDENEDVRDAAIETISDYCKGRRKYQVMVDSLDNPYSNVVEMAVFNLGFYTDVDFQTAEEWKKWWAENKDTFVPND
ncbi:HEAT repeat domain-containing protein [bacterium]|nr:HEAT repeat domain-containing protein [bacterium]